MKTNFDELLQFLPTVLVLILILFLIYLCKLIDKYIKLKMNYYTEKLKELEKRNDKTN